MITENRRWHLGRKESLKIKSRADGGGRAKEKQTRKLRKHCITIMLHDPDAAVDDLSIYTICIMQHYCEVTWVVKWRIYP